jgi:hypothetical protein
MKTVYIETSIPSFYHEIRTGAEMEARRNWTRQWWEGAGQRQKVWTSQAVLSELEEGDYPTKEDCLRWSRALPLLEVTGEIAAIVDVYLQNQLMPENRVGDALHLAIASYHKCDFLLTWNCKHIANANKFGHIRIINQRLNLFTPALVTPMELCEEESE